MNKLLLFLRGCVFGLCLFALVLFTGDVSSADRTLIYWVAIAIAVLLLGYCSVKFPSNFWGELFPKKDYQK